MTSRPTKKVLRRRSLVTSVLTEHEREQLRELAERDGRSTSAMIRRLIQQALRTDLKAQERAS